MLAVDELHGHPPKIVDIQFGFLVGDEMGASKSTLVRHADIQNG
ncbi:hypothetical protein PRUB_a2615 [Pseudoalteromonas rubra]|uniref:Uncharacterized protein n=1 Tax=Pseudoalteromonas rubra TaxID=43658 RepID=A0A8T0CBI5_9GAMM|nr:hypothetical protein PRUB_a2615 [Pseudoalteromonas rubra]